MPDQEITTNDVAAATDVIPAAPKQEPTETRPLKPGLYKAFLLQLQADGVETSSVNMFPSGASYVIQFPESSAVPIDAVLANIGEIEASALAVARARAYRRVVDFVDGVTKVIVKQYPDAETMAWPTKQAEARAVLAGGDIADTLILKELAAAMDLDAAGVTALANSVLEKAAGFAKMSAAIEGLRNLAETQIAALTSVDDAAPLVENLMVIVKAKAVELGFGDAVSSI